MFKTFWNGQHTAQFVGILLTAALSILASFQSHQGPWLERLELLYYDWRFNAVPLQGEQTESDVNIVIVDIDEASLASVGQWPWRRQVLANLVNQLANQGAVVVGFDVVFAEHEQDPLKLLARQINVPAADISQAIASAGLSSEATSLRLNGERQLADAMSNIDVVLGIFFQPDQALQSGTLPGAISALSSEHPTSYITMPGYSSAVPELMAASASGGFVSTFGDEDGIIRRSPLVIRYQDHLYPSLSLAMAMTYLFDFQLVADEVDVGGWKVPRYLGIKGHMARTDALGQVLVPFKGREGSFPYVSAADVLTGQLQGEASNRSLEEILEGALVLIGTSAQGLTDLRSTPVGARYPGVEVHANILHALLTERFPYQPEWVSGAAFSLMMLVGVLLSVSLPGASPFKAILGSVVMVSLILVVNLWLWRYHYLDLPLAGLLMLALLLVLLNLGYSFVTENHTRRRLKGIFDQYVPPAHIEHMMEEPDAYQLTGENRELTVLFSDIRSFTSISENLSAAELTQLLNHYFTPVTKTIFDHDGTIDKYVGDLVMAFWGAPVSDERHASKAVATALALNQVVEDLQPQFQNRGWPAIRAGIGLNSGDMNVGDMGSAYRRAYTVLGDSVNLGSRLEGLTKFYGLSLLVGERTRELADDFEYRYIDRIQVKGKELPVNVFEPIGPIGCLSKAEVEELDEYQQALDLYFEQNWLVAEEGFLRLSQHYPERLLYRVYLQRIAEWKRHPPENWDGSFRHTSK